MQINGANHTPNTSQFHTAIPTSCGRRSQPHASNPYAAWTVNAEGRLNTEVDVPEGLDTTRLQMSGMPRVTASVAAREKLRREVMEMTVDARQRLKDCKSIENGAISGG